MPRCKIYANKSAWIDVENRDKNNSTSKWLSVYSPDKAFIRFDEELINKYYNRIKTIYMRAASNVAMNCRMNYITSQWDEKTITYNNYPDFSDYNKMFYFNTANKYDITVLSKEQLNKLKQFGLCLEGTSGSSSERYVYSSRSELPPYLEFDLNTLIPTVTNIRVDSKNIETSISTTWDADEQTSYLFEAYQNGIMIYSKNEETNVRQCIIPASIIRSSEDVTIKVRVTFVEFGETTESELATYTFTPTINKPALANLTVLGQYYEKEIVVNWRATHLTNYDYELYYNNINIKTGQGGLENEFTIPPNTFTGILPASVRVRAKNTSHGITVHGEWQERSITLKEIVPTVNNLSLSGSNVDLELTFNWDSTDQEKYEVEAYKSDSRVLNYSGTTDKFKVIQHSTLTTGLHKFKVRVAYKDRWTEWKEISTTLVETLPSIGVLEPDGVIAKRDDPIHIWWTSQNQSKWQIKVDGELLTYTGTIEKDKILPPSTLSTGPHTIVLTVTYITSGGVEKSVSKKAEFIAQGKPPSPTITSPFTFNTSRPTVTWDTQDTQGYILEVLKDDNLIYTTEWQNGLITEHKIREYLEDGTYTVRVKVMNQYSLESNYGAKQFTISTDLTTQINLKSMMISNYVSLSWDNIEDKFDKFYILRNGIVIARTIGTNFDDYTAHKECIYTIRGITSNDVFKDSNKTYECVTINRSIVATVDNLSNMIEIVCMTNNNKFSGNLSLSHSLIHLTGREYPISIFGEHKTNKYNLKLEHCNDLFEFIEMYSRCKVFCYRDALDKIFFTIPTLQYKRDSIALDFEVDIAAIQVDYSEVVDYD